MVCAHFRPQSISKAHAIEQRFLLKACDCILSLQTLPLQEERAEQLALKVAF